MEVTMISWIDSPRRSPSRPNRTTPPSNPPQSSSRSWTKAQNPPQASAVPRRIYSLLMVHIGACWLAIFCLLVLRFNTFYLCFDLSAGALAAEVSIDSADASFFSAKSDVEVTLIGQSHLLVCFPFNSLSLSLLVRNLNVVIYKGRGYSGRS